MIFVSSGAFKTANAREVLETCATAGFTELELSSGLQYTDGLLADVRRCHGRPFRYLVHNYFPPHARPFVLNLASLDATTLDRARDHCKAGIDLSVEFGAPFFSVHAGSAMNATAGDLGKPQLHLAHGEIDRAYGVFVETLVELAAYADSRNVNLLVENHVVASFNVTNGGNRFLFASTANDIIRLMRDVGSPRLRLLVDVGHLNVTANSLQFDRYRFIEDVAPWIDAFHLSDNDGHADQNLSFGRDAWFMNVIGQFPDAVHVIEAYRLDVPAIRACCDLVGSVVQ